MGKGMVAERIMPQLKKERYHKINLLFAATLFAAGIFNIILCVLILKEPLLSTLIGIDVLLLILLGFVFLTLYLLPAKKWLKNIQILILFGIGFMMIPTNPPDNFSGHIFIILSLFLTQRYGLLNKNLPQKLLSLSVLLAGSITLSIITFEGSFLSILGSFLFVLFYYGLIYIIFEEEFQKLLRKVKEDKPLVNLGRNVSMVVHNLKNSINTIENQITFMEEGMVPDDEAGYGLLRRYTDELYERLARLSYSITVNDASHEDIIDLSTVAGSVVETLNLDREVKNRVTIYTAFHRGVRIRAVPLDVKEIIENVLINAVEAMPSDRMEKGSITLSIRNDDEQGIAIVEITDDGAGIPGWTGADNARESSLFSNRFHLGRSSKPGGTGQGIIYIMQTLHKYKGDIKITSHKGKGTTVRMMLPLVTDTELQRASVVLAEVSDAVNIGAEH
jgi:signal transduction histidine kinase